MVVQGEPAATVYGHKLSTVVPRTVTGDSVAHELGGMDLIMKLHYLRSVYYFKQSEALDDLTIIGLKEPMFGWLDLYYPAAGRIRPTDSGWPVVRCNDSGVRIVEAKCTKTLDEWFKDADDCSSPPQWRQLVPDKVLGPELQYSPLVYLQFTKFRCGSVAVGYSWPHILGDAMSATNCINLWGHLLRGNPPPKSVKFNNQQSQKEISLEEVIISRNPLSVKQVELAKDCWLIPNDLKMSTYCLEITETKLKALQKENMKIAPFELISAIIWQCLAKHRVGREPTVITICRSHQLGEKGGVLSNKQKISTVTTNSSPAKIGISELATLISQDEVDESKSLEGMLDRDSGKPDFFLYGANLTFVDMEGIELHGLELKGQKPIQVDYNIDGVGEEGVVLVFKGALKAAVSGENIERTVMMILPEHQIQQTKDLLINELSIKEKYGNANQL